MHPHDRNPQPLGMFPDRPPRRFVDGNPLAGTPPRGAKLNLSRNKHLFETRSGMRRFHVVNRPGDLAEENLLRTKRRRINGDKTTTVADCFPVRRRDAVENTPENFDQQAEREAFVPRRAP